MMLSCRVLIVRQGEDGEAQRVCSSPTMLCDEVQPLFLAVSKLSTIRHRSGGWYGSVSASLVLLTAC